MVVKHNLVNNELYLYFYGEIDEHGVSGQKAKIDKLIDENAFVKSVIFNFENVSFMDSTGIGVLISKYKQLKGADSRLYVRKPSKSIDKIFNMAGLYSIMPKIS